MKRITKRIKKSIFLISAVFFMAHVFSQEEVLSEEQSDSIKSFDFVLQFEPAVYINTQSTLVSAPSPVVYPISFGVSWPNNNSISIQPTISFFMMNHLFYENRALPAEIENRTTTTLSFMLNIPAVYSVFLDNSRFQFSAGPAALMRFGLLSPGVKESDSGWSGTATSDVSKINAWFWNSARWFYFNAGASWLYNVSKELKAGPTLNCYIPLGVIITDHDVQGMIISLGIKICR